MTCINVVMIGFNLNSEMSCDGGKRAGRHAILLRSSTRRACACDGTTWRERTRTLDGGQREIGIFLSNVILMHFVEQCDYKSTHAFSTN